MHTKNRTEQSGEKRAGKTSSTAVKRSRHIYAEELADMFVDDVADADRRRDFEEVRRETVIKTSRSFVLQYRPKETSHRCLRAV